MTDLRDVLVEIANRWFEYREKARQQEILRNSPVAEILKAKAIALEALYYDLARNHTEFIFLGKRIPDEIKYQTGAHMKPPDLVLVFRTLRRLTVTTEAAARVARRNEEEEYHKVVLECQRDAALVEAWKVLNSMSEYAKHEARTNGHRLVNS